MQNPAITQTPIHEIIAKRWSPRAFDANKSVTQEQVIAFLEAARWAPSCFGDQPWRFIVWNKAHDPAAWQQAFNCIVPNNQTWVKDVPVLVLACADTLFSHNQTPNRWGQYDTGAAVENLCLQAASMGLVTHQMGGFNSDKTREVFSIPSQFTPMAMLAVGYEGDANNLPDELKVRELGERKRKPLGELFFNGVWNKPI
jgi:nitroreductase